VEKGLNTARAELGKLEEDVARRVRKVVEDQAALKRWAAELDRRDADLNTRERGLGAHGQHHSGHF